MSNSPQSRPMDYERDEDMNPGGGVAQVVSGLQAIDLILPAVILLGGFMLISNANQTRREKKLSRKEWRRNYLIQKGVSSKSQLSPYDQRKMQEAEERRFGKSRFRGRS